MTKSALVIQPAAWVLDEIVARCAHNQEAVVAIVLEIGTQARRSTGSKATGSQP